MQGRGQSLNMRDNGVKVIVGQRKGGKAYDLCLEDGWKPGETLFDPEEAATKGTVVQYLLSDAGQKEMWPKIKPLLTKGKALYFSHGFSIVFNDQTGVIPPPDIDVILVAPKGSGTTVRRLFLEGRGINCQLRRSTRTRPAAPASAASRSGIAIGSGYLFETTFKKEVVSDLTGERGVLMGAIYGLWLAQYEVLRANGHSPSEAFNETVEEATQSLYPLIAEKGMDWMYANCSTTAQRGALDWFKAFRDASQAGVRATVPIGRDGRGGAAHARGQQPPRLPAAVGEGVEGDRRERDVEGRGAGARAAARAPGVSTACYKYPRE